jgi:molybdenum cofactor cytidylyltransferase
MGGRGAMRGRRERRTYECDQASHNIAEFSLSDQSGAQRSEPPPFRSACVVLAAGAGTRFGEPKVSVLVRDGVRFVDAIVDIARVVDLAPIIVVGPPRLSLPSGARLVVNPDAKGEQIQSLRLGLAQLVNVPVSGALVWPVDHPYVELASVLAILDAAERSGAPIVVPRSGTRRGHPVFFSRALWPDLMTVPAGGARAVVHAHEREVHEVIVDGSGILRDIDTPADMAGPEEAARDAVP